jgi:SAM-dependent methyltransferase
MSKHTPLTPFTPAELDALTRKTLEHYESNAASFWEGTRDHDVSENRAALLRALPTAPGAPARILDVGCGPGRDLAAFRSLGHEVVGLDGTPRFCEMARAFSGCEVLERDFRALDFDLGASRFDGIFANASLFHVPRRDLPRVLRVLRAALAPRGVLFTSNPRGRDEEGPSGARFGAYHTEDTWRRFVTEAGFVEVESYYRPAGKPREEQPWFASVWRRVPTASEALDAGARLFDAGAFWDAHEAWEERWRVERDEAERQVLQGLIQIAAAFHKLVVTVDGAAAARLFDKGLAKMATSPEGASPRLAGRDLGAFRDAVATFARAAEVGGAADEPPQLAPYLASS